MEFSPAHRFLLFVFISLASFLIVLDYSIANVSIPYIAGSLSVSNEQGTYVITTFAVGSAISLAMTGFLSKRIGEVRLLVSSILLFTFFSWVCGISISLEMIVVSRFLQGLVAGPLVPLSLSTLIKYGTEKTRTRDISIWSTIVIAAPVVGPVMGGWLSDWYSWPWIFYINIPIGIPCALVLWLLLRDKETPIVKVPSDIPGIILLALFVSSLQVILDKGQQWDWWRSELIWILAIITILSFTYLLIRERWTEHPLLDLSLFKIPTFLISVICLVFSYAVYFGSVVVVPLWLQEYMGYNAEWAGMAVCTLGIAPVLFTMVTPHIIHRFGNLKTLMLSLFLFGAGCLYSLFFTPQVDFYHVAMGRFIFGFGFVCYAAPLFGLCVQEIPKERLPSATGIYHFVRAMVGGFGTSIFTTIWMRRTYFHHMRTAEVLTPYNPLLPSEPNIESLTLLNRGVDVQAALLAINDIFLLMTLLYVALIIGLAVVLYFYKDHVPSEVHANE
jgi:DHA2 family multidrug resistance protein